MLARLTSMLETVMEWADACSRSKTKRSLVTAVVALLSRSVGLGGQNDDVANS
jgi:hypothetical protein